MSDFLRENPIGDTDSYKTSHYLQYPPGMSGMFSYLESRGGEFDRTVFFGLQYIIKRFLQALVETADIDEMETFCKLHQVPFPRKGMERVRDLGYFPVCIRAVREGTVVPVQNVLMSVESTDPETFWIVGWLETILMRIWYPITVATLSWHCKKDILGFLVRSADEPMSEIDYKLHDFGSRGSSSSETALIGGMAHCANFKGSDNILAVRGANFYYRNEMAATSIPAAEHSTITSWGRENEIDAYRNMIAQFAKPGKMLAVVSDSYDLYNVVENVWGELLRESVESSGAKLVMRPDSGVPVIVVPKCLRLLDSKIPFALNTKGYKILPPYYGLLQGDGVNHRSINAILDEVVATGYSASNVNFGMGGALLQKVDRDTQEFAFKCSAGLFGTEWRPIYKDPITDSKKRSKRGRLDLVQGPNGPETVPEGSTNARSLLHVVYENGKTVGDDQTLDQVRALTNAALS